VGSIPIRSTSPFIEREAMFDDESKRSLGRIGSLVDSIHGIASMRMREWLTRKTTDPNATVPAKRIYLVRMVWCDDGGKELLGWVHETVDEQGRKTNVSVHMAQMGVKYLIVEYTETSKQGVELAYRVTWAEGFIDARITVAVLLGLEHPEQVVFE
jgi:hypothetical protein